MPRYRRKRRLKQRANRSIIAFTIQKYDICQKELVDVFRKSSIEGIIKLDSTRKQVMFAENYIVGVGKNILKEAKEYGFKTSDKDDKQLIKDLIGGSAEYMQEYLYKIRNEHYVKANIKAISYEKEKAQTPQELLEILTKEQKFFNNLRNNLKDKNQDENLLKSIQQADKNEKNNIIEQLHKIVNFHVDKGITKPEDIAKTLKSTVGTHSIEATCKSLILSYQNHAVRELQRCLNGIHAGKIVNMDGKKFDCQTKFLEHVLKIHANNEFLPRKTIENAHAKLVEHNLQKNYSIEL